MDSKLLYNQIKEQLPPMEGVAVKVEDNKMNFYIDGRLEFYVRESGGVSYMPNCSDTDKVKNICGEIVRTSRFVREYLETIEQAPDFEVEGLENKYKLLAQFNNTVLAARVNGVDHVEFVTWDEDSRGVSAEDINNFDFEAIGKKLIELGNGRITRYGNIYTNSDLEYYEPCTRESLPPFQFYDNQPVCVEMSYQGNANHVYLPDTRMAFERAAFRMGARDVSKCKCKIDYTEFNVKESQDLNSVEMQYDKL